MSQHVPDPLAILVADHPRLQPLIPAVRAAAGMISACHRAGGWVMACGNGGSASDADHLVGELMKGFLSRRTPAAAELRPLVGADPAWPALAPRLQRGIRAFSLVAHSALVSAIANDLHADLVFAQQVFAAARPGDLVIGFSTSGNSINVVRALQVARARGVATLGFTGATPAAMDACCDLVLKAPASETFRIQECHLPLYHAVCAQAEAELFAD